MSDDLLQDLRGCIGARRALLAPQSADLTELLERAATRIEELERAVSFARSTIKSGEGWTDECERILR